MDFIDERAAWEKKNWGRTGILANVQGKIGAPYRDMTQKVGELLKIISPFDQIRIDRFTRN